MTNKCVLAAAALLVEILAGDAYANPPPDLAIDSFAVQVTQTTVVYTATICNIAKNGPAPASALGLYYDRSSEPACSTSASHTWAVPALQPEACTTLNHTRANTPIGSYRSWVFADPTCSLKEAAETNNTASERFLVIPELRVVDFTASVAADRSVTFATTITNDGIAIIAPFEVGLFYDGSDAPDCGDPAEAVWPLLNGLASEESATHSFSRTAVAAGIYRAWVYADHACTITEDSEDNNIRSVEYIVGPNIRLVNAQASASATTVTYQVTACNEGSEATGPFEVALWYDRSSTPGCSSTGASHSWTHSGLEPGDCATLTRSRDNVIGGSYTAQFLADADCAVAEASEDDNLSSQGYSVAGHDLYVASFTTTVTNKTSARYEASVCNSGSAVPSSFSAGIYFNRADRPDCTVTPSHQDTFAGLAQGACETIAVTEDNLPPGEQLAWVVVDNGCDVIEDSESNNSESSALTIAHWPDLTVTEVTADVQGTTVRIYATICSNGTTGIPLSKSGFYFRLDEPPPFDCSLVPHDSQTVPALAIGACTNQVWVREDVPTGAYTSYVTSDVDCAIDELDETNNSAAIAYSVGPPDDASVTRDAEADLGDLDAGATDASNQEQPDGDAATDAGGTVSGGSGCSCDLAVEDPEVLALALVALTCCLRRRRFFF